MGENPAHEEKVFSSPGGGEKMNQAIRREGRALSLPMEAQAAIAPFSVAIVFIVQHFLWLCPEFPKNSINIDKYR